MIAAGNGMSCGLRSGGALYCWGKNAEQTPKGSYRRVSVGFDHGCAIRAEEPRIGELDCWGRDDKGQASPPAGKFIEVAAGYAHTCALRPNGTAQCFGRDPRGASKPPAGTRFTAITAGKGFSCGLTKTDASVECWGESENDQSAGAIGHFAMVSSGAHHSCALAEDGTLECWGTGKKSGGELKVPEGRFRAVAVGLEQACGLLRDRTIVCFAGDASGSVTAPDGEFFALASGWVHVCGIRMNGDVECWGSDFNGEAQPHAQFTHVNVPAGKGGGGRAAVASRSAAKEKTAVPPAQPDEPEKPEPAAEPAKPEPEKTAAKAGGDDMTFGLEEAEAEEAKPKPKKAKEKPVNLNDFLK
jgi:alpha-tubulin suppressor-like RCC1 family protein